MESKNYKKLYIMSFFAFIFLVFITNLIFLDSDDNDLFRENRQAAAKPVFSFSSYIDGSYFSKYTSFINDHFIMRNSFIDIAETFSELKGYSDDGAEIFTSDKSLIDFGVKTDENNTSKDNTSIDNKNKDNTNDDIPVAKKEDYKSESDKIADSNIKDPSIDASNKTDNNQNNNDTSSNVSEEDSSKDEAEDTNELNEYGQFIVVNNTGFELYSYNEYFMSFYVNALNYYAKNLPEDVAIYSILAPTSSEFNLPEKYKELTDSQKKGIEYIDEKLDERIKRVDVYSELEKHKDEYLYFKTDHHWTALGAYRGYEAFMSNKGISAIELENYEKIDSSKKFTGSIYGMTSSKKLLKNKDEIWYYKIPDKVEYEIFDVKGNSSKAYSVFYKNYFKKDSQYAVFMGGDQPFAKITTDHTDMGKVLIVKDSYANAFIPFLIPHYSEIYVADPRSCPFDISDVINENDIKEIIFLDYAMVLKLPGFSDMIKNLADFSTKNEADTDNEAGASAEESNNKNSESDDTENPINSNENNENGNGQSQNNDDSVDNHGSGNNEGNDDNHGSGNNEGNDDNHGSEDNEGSDDNDGSENNEGTDGSGNNN